MQIAIARSVGRFPDRPPRLHRDSYIGYHRYFVTTCVALRRPAFTQHWLATNVTAQLRRQASLFDFALAAYCLMPDHLHVLLHANSERSDLQAFMKQFKQMTGFAYKQQMRQTLWQKGFHDRILRNGESSESIARYILENPIRAGLTAAWGEYPYAWSDVYDLDGLFTDWDAATNTRS